MKKLIPLLIFSFLCTACEQDKAASAPTKTLEEINVQVETTPETIYINDEVTLKVIVTQGNEKVDDASEVMFEIWKQGEEEHEMMEAVHEDGGVYTIETSFAEDGTYSVIAHTSARDLHVMPEVELTVNKH